MSTAGWFFLLPHWIIYMWLACAAVGVACTAIDLNRVLKHHPRFCFGARPGAFTFWTLVIFVVLSGISFFLPSGVLEVIAGIYALMVLNFIRHVYVLFTRGWSAFTAAEQAAEAKYQKFMGKKS
jgi:hypothetical protein